MSENQEWIPCNTLELGETYRWDEPLWAAPNKPRGKRDKIGEQQITATVKSDNEFLEFEVLSVSKISGDEAELQVKEGDTIRRKRKSIRLGACHKAV